MTARRPTANRVWTNSHILSSAIPTWAHAMGAAGYETALVGRMHFVGPDQRHGFERRPIGEYFAGYPGSPYQGAPLFRKIDVATTGLERISVETAGWGRTTYQAFDEMVTDAACDYLAEKAGEGDGRPFAAVVGYVLPHCPFFAPKELFDYYRERVDIASQTTSVPPAVQKFRRMSDIDRPIPEEQIRAARAAYFGMCEMLDGLIGIVVGALEAMGLERNTLVVYCSDHGEMAGEHGCWWKCTYYEGSVGVPLVAALPGVIPAGSTCERVCNLMDIGPTMLDMADALPMPEVDGRSLWPLLQGHECADWLDETSSELLLGWWDVPSRMIRRGPWKLYAHADATPPVLYNLDDDPDELHDRGSERRFEPVRRELMGRLTDGWDPNYVLSEHAALSRDMALLAQWGRVVEPVHEDTLPVPDAEDVTIV